MTPMVNINLAATNQ